MLLRLLEAHSLVIDIINTISLAFHLSLEWRSLEFFHSHFHLHHKESNQLRASRAFHWRGKGPKSSFSIVYLWISSIRSSYILVILVHFLLFFIFVSMLMFSFSFCLILVNSSIVFFLTSLHTTVMTSRAQLGM
jgi:hypothetical protein